MGKDTPSTGYAPQQVAYDASGPSYKGSSPYGETNKGYGGYEEKYDMEAQKKVYGKQYENEEPKMSEAAGSNKLSADLPATIRHAFVRKVYTLVSLQLLYTFAFASIFTFSTAAGEWLIQYWYIGLIFSIMGLIVTIGLSCSPETARRYPQNVIILAFITFCMSWSIATAGVVTNPLAFCAAAAMTSAVAIALTIFAIQTKYDFTGYHCFVLIGLIILITLGIFAAIFPNKILNLVYASLGALFFSIILVCDTQRIVGGKHRKYQYSLDDYVFAALTLYIDIINLFMFILQILQGSGVGQ